MTESVPIWEWDEDTEQRLVWGPITLPPEFYADLDLQLLTATDEHQRWEVLIAGTAEVLNRFDHLADPKVLCATEVDLIAGFAESRRQLHAHGAYQLAGAISEAIGVLNANQALQERCISYIREGLGSGHQEAVAAINSAASSLHAAAEYLRAKRFRPLPPYSTAQPDYGVMTAALWPLGAENHRNPLRKQLDGAGGAAGSPQYNPYVAGLYELELATHRRLYRFAYELAVYVGIDLSDQKLWKTPDQVDQEPF